MQRAILTQLAHAQLMCSSCAARATTQSHDSCNSTRGKVAGEDMYVQALGLRVLDDVWARLRLQPRNLYSSLRIRTFMPVYT